MRLWAPASSSTNTKERMLSQPNKLSQHNNPETATRKLSHSKYPLTRLRRAPRSVELNPPINSTNHINGQSSLPKWSRSASPHCHSHVNLIRNHRGEQDIIVFAPSVFAFTVGLVHKRLLFTHQLGAEHLQGAVKPPIAIRSNCRDPVVDQLVTV